MILAEQNEIFARYRAIHHLLTDHVVTRFGDTAQVRVNRQATHLRNAAGNSAELQTRRSPCSSTGWPRCQA